MLAWVSVPPLLSLLLMIVPGWVHQHQLRFHEGR